MEIQYTLLALAPEFGRLDFLEWKQKRVIMNYRVCMVKWVEGMTFYLKIDVTHCFKLTLHWVSIHHIL